MSSSNVEAHHDSARATTVNIIPKGVHYEESSFHNYRRDHLGVFRQA